MPEYLGVCTIQIHLLLKIKFDTSIYTQSIINKTCLYAEIEQLEYSK